MRTAVIVLSLAIAGIAIFYASSDVYTKYEIRMMCLTPVFAIARLFGFSLLKMRLYEHEGYEYMRGPNPVDCVQRAMEYQAKPNDLFIVSYPRTGTHMLMNALAQLTGHHEFEHIGDVTYALEFGGTAPSFNAQHLDDPSFPALSNPRIIASHMPVMHIPFSKQSKYIVIFRNPLDAFVSCAKLLGVFFGDFTPSMDEMIASMIERENYGMVEWMSGWYAKAEQNPDAVLVVFYEDFVRNRDTEMRRIAKFVGMDVPEERMKKAIENSSFKWVKAHESAFAFRSPMPLTPPGNHSFLRKGQIGGFSAELTKEQIARIEKHLKWRFARTNTNFPLNRYGLATDKQHKPEVYE